MNLDKIVEEKFIRDLVKRKLSYHAISERLQALNPGRFRVFSCCFLQFIQILICHFEPIVAFLSWLTAAQGLSSRSVRRYCKERKINVSALHWVSENCLEEMVVRNIEQVCIYIQVLTKFVLPFPARLPDLRWRVLWIFLLSSMYVGNVRPLALSLPYLTLPYPSPYPSLPLFFTKYPKKCFFHSMDIRMDDAWCREPFVISCNKVHAIVKSVSGEYQVCWEKLLPAPTTKWHMTYWTNLIMFHTLHLILVINCIWTKMRSWHRNLESPMSMLWMAVVGWFLDL